MKKIIYMSAGLIALSAFLYISFGTSSDTNINKEIDMQVEATNTNTTATSTPEKVSTTTSDKVVTGTKKISSAELALHNRKEDCWLSINNNVLDVTSFISIHPGGDKILKGCGVDATNYFNKVPGHMKGMAQGLLNKLKIGELE